MKIGNVIQWWEGKKFGWTKGTIEHIRADGNGYYVRRHRDNKLVYRRESRKKMSTKACGNEHCSISTGIHDGLTFGTGDLDDYGYWEKPCGPCARAWEATHPSEGACWPFVQGD